ncbi:hypothetical protein OSB04_007201 [Centaurea solstitialis]|uniref:Uncharacterized protein n=1 Tax=Centaurea solstitialis TaxID=347529 RepID=A0AA38WT56_9ASTR|nr:hypothetical protein OSB04_007201 [Centaurea solstitialis]
MEPEPVVLRMKELEPEPEPLTPVLYILETVPELPGTGSDTGYPWVFNGTGYPAGKGSIKMRIGTGTGLDRFHILGTGTTHIGSDSETGSSLAVPVPKAEIIYNTWEINIA